MGVRTEQHPLDHPGEVPQVKDVMGLGGRGQEVLHGSSVDRHSGLDQHLPIPREEGEGRPVKERPELRAPDQHPGGHSNLLP